VVDKIRCILLNLGSAAWKYPSGLLALLQPLQATTLYEQAKPAIHPNHELVLVPTRRRAAAILFDWIVPNLFYFSTILLFRCVDMNRTKIDVRAFFDVEMETENTTSTAIILLKFLFGLFPILCFTHSFLRLEGQTIGKYLISLGVLRHYHERLCWWHPSIRSPGYFACAPELEFRLIQVR